MAQSSAGAASAEAPHQVVAARLGATLREAPTLAPEHVSAVDRVALYNPELGGDPWMALAYYEQAAESDAPAILSDIEARAARLRNSVL